MYSESGDECDQQLVICRQEDHYPHVRTKLLQFQVNGISMINHSRPWYAFTITFILLYYGTIHIHSHLRNTSQVVMDFHGYLTMNSPTTHDVASFWMTFTPFSRRQICMAHPSILSTTWGSSNLCTLLTFKTMSRYSIMIIKGTLNGNQLVVVMNFEGICPRTLHSMSKMLDTFLPKPM